MLCSKQSRAENAMNAVALHWTLDTMDTICTFHKKIEKKYDRKEKNKLKRKRKEKKEERSVVASPRRCGKTLENKELYKETAPPRPINISTYKQSKIRTTGNDTRVEEQGFLPAPGSRRSLRYE